MPAPELSVIVPAYNEEGRLGDTLRTASGYLAEHHPAHELLVVDDGSTDGTVALVRGIQAELEAIRLIESDGNHGKGHAVRSGMLAARGDRRLFMDADLSTPMEELPKLLAALDAGADVAIGSRGLPESDLRKRQNLLRENMGKTFNLLVRALVGAGFRDTQCGFKLFRREAAEDLFGRSSLEGFAFDVELLLLARGRWKVSEVPIAWVNSPHSKVSPLLDSARMLADVCRLRLKGVGRGG
jgi:dolichyl-phosphate beta-glucosyltransferase